MESVLIEIGIKVSSRHTHKELINHSFEYLQTKEIRSGLIYTNFAPETEKFLYENVCCLIIAECSKQYNFFDQSSIINLNSMNINWSVYVLHQASCEKESEQLDETEINYSSTYTLPNQEFYNLWENLVFDVSIKESLMKYVTTALLFANKKVDTNIISCNRIVLLHGPPGTGKTSLCKALAHKVVGRLRSKFKKGFLMEIHSHSLFSKWFSESGKIISKIFNKIEEDLQNEDVLLFILLDEVESLTHARASSFGGHEPTDSVRAVNALLTEIDRIKNKPNVIILTTSNLTNAIDVAFVDRADIVQYIGLPSTQAIYQIYYSCIQELIAKKIIFSPVNVVPYECLSTLKKFGCQDFKISAELDKISEMSQGLSGRTLRKLPFLAHALFSTQQDSITLEEYLQALEKAVIHHKTNCTKHA